MTGTHAFPMSTESVTRFAELSPLLRRGCGDGSIRYETAEARILIRSGRPPPRFRDLYPREFWIKV
jgi:hypothetical protein